MAICYKSFNRYSLFKDTRQECQIHLRHLNVLQLFIQWVVIYHWVPCGISYINTVELHIGRVEWNCMLTSQGMTQKVIVLYDIDWLAKSPKYHDGINTGPSVKSLDIGSFCSRHHTLCSNHCGGLVPHFQYFGCLSEFQYSVYKDWSTPRRDE